MKKFGCIVIVFLMVFYFITAPAEALYASRRGLYLWFEQLLPTLLPFSILSYVVLASGLFSCGKTRIRAKISGFEWYVVFCGFLFGFPIGSKLAADLYGEGKISKKNASILCCFTNNLSPVFVTTAFTSMLHLSVSPMLYFVLYGIPLSCGLCSLLRSGERAPVQNNAASGFHLNMQIIDDGIVNGFETLIRICGYIMMFSILSEFIKTVLCRNPMAGPIFVGLTEVTNGIACLADSAYSDTLKYLLATLFLAWNGISGLFQTASILAKTDLSLKGYIGRKLALCLLQSCAAGILAVPGYFLV